MSPFSVGPVDTPQRGPRRSTLVGVVVGVVVVLLAAIVVFATSNRGDDRTGVFGPGATSTTEAPRAPGSGADGTTTTRKPNTDAAGAEYSTCRPIPQPFPIGERTCTIVRPPDVAPGERLPAIVLLHGWNTTPSQVLANGAWGEAVVRNRLLVAAPAGLFQGWNAGGCCGFSQGTQIDDVGFLQQVIEQLRERPDVDPDRVYAVGESNGGMMVHRLICVAADRLAGAASIAGTPVANCEPNAPIPVLHVHGTGDLTVPYHGGQSAISWVMGVTFPAVGSAIPRIAEAEGCAPEPTRRGGGGVTVEEWTGCRDGVPLRLVTIDGGRHVWFRDDRYDATSEVVEFFGLGS